jgi:hypothetical protein
MQINAIYLGEPLFEGAYLESFFRELEPAFLARAEEMILKVTVRPPYPSALSYRLGGVLYSLDHDSKRSDCDIIMHFRMLCALPIEFPPKQIGRFTALVDEQRVTFGVEIEVDGDDHTLKLIPNCSRECD